MASVNHVLYDQNPAGLAFCEETGGPWNR